MSTFRFSPSRRVAAALCVVLSVAACRELTFEPEDPTTVTYAPALGVTLSAYMRLPSGVYYQDVAVGSGALVTDSSTVTVAYRGRLADGTTFDSTRTAQTDSFDLRGTIKGWQSGLSGARAGGRRRLIIPPSQGYGNTSRQGIPAGSVLWFEIDIARVTTPVTPPPTTTTAARTTR